jgi:hypothetical protein
LDLAKLSLDEELFNGSSDGVRDAHIIEVCCCILGLFVKIPKYRSLTCRVY